MTKDQKSEKTKKEYKDYSSLRAWQVGHDLNVATHALMQEYESDEQNRPWCDQVKRALHDSVVQLMEAFRKYSSEEKLKRYDASLYYTNQALYTLLLGQQLGIWQAAELTRQLEEYQGIVRGSAYYFVKELKEKRQAAEGK